MEERRSLKTAMTDPAKHNLILENRGRLILSGVEDVDSFDEQTIELLTTLGLLTVKGAQLRINKLNVENGELVIEGEIDSINYSGAERGEKGAGFFAKMFR